MYKTYVSYYRKLKTYNNVCRRQVQNILVIQVASWSDLKLILELVVSYYCNLSTYKMFVSYYRQLSTYEMYVNNRYKIYW